MRTPFTMIFGFSPLTILLMAGGPLIVGILLRRAEHFRKIVLALTAVVILLTVLLQFERSFHAAGWLNLYLGVPLSYLLLGMLLGRLCTLSHKQK